MFNRITSKYAALEQYFTNKSELKKFFENSPKIFLFMQNSYI